LVQKIERRYLEFDSAPFNPEQGVGEMSVEAKLRGDFGKLRTMPNCGYDLNLMWAAGAVSNLDQGPRQERTSTH